MKKYFLSIVTALLAVLGMNAQVANFSNGYYRVNNYHTNRYIYVLDNKGELLVQQSTADMNAIALYKGLERAISDPASVLYIEKHDNKYDIQAQSTGIYAIISTYVNLIHSPKIAGAYYAYGSKSGATLYLYDAVANLNSDQGFLGTSGAEERRNWYVTPISTDSENYFGVKPTISLNGKYYQAFYADFPFSTASTGMKVYYVSKVDEKNGLVVFKEITGTVPRATPVFIECSSDQTINNKLNIGGSASAISGNKLVGVYFENHLNKHENYVTYNKTTMRSLGVMSNGQLGMVTGNYKDVPRNTFYLPVSSSAPAEMRLVTEEEYNRLVVTDPVLPTGITLSATQLTMTIGDTQTLTATVKPDDTTDPTVTWTSSNTSVATVEGGRISAVGIGSATITAKCGNVQATCQVTVQGIQATSVTLSQTALTLNTGESQNLTATVAPSNVTDKTIVWTTSDASIATVLNGTVTGISPGTATITARCGSVQATCQVTVKAIPVTSLTLNTTSMALNVGDTQTLVATVAPANATYKNVSWSSSNTAVATVDNQGKVTGRGAGNAVITARCGDFSATCDVTVTTVAAQSLTLNNTEVEMHIGERTRLVATVLPANTTDKTVQWTSSDETVATVDQNGNVSALKLGSAVITATCGTVSATCTINVTPVQATSIVLTETSLTLTIGQQQRVDCQILPINTTDKTIVIRSSDTSVATVSGNGTITAVSVGHAVVTWTCGAATASCDVTVVPVYPTGVTLNKTSLNLTIGESETLVATVSPENTTDPTVTWSTSNANVATVDQSGKVSAVGVGYATITATCGSVSATCTVSVSPIAATGVTLNKTTLGLTIGESETLVATVSPENTTDPTVTWTSSNPSVATVDQSGKVTAIGVGSATITARCGSASARCYVTVSPIDATGVSLNKTSLDLKIGAYEYLVATVSPANTTYPTVTWTSSNPSVATVDGNGKVTGVSTGTAVITATCGAVSATCTVTVTPVEATQVILNKSVLSLVLGASETLSATVLPANATDKTVVWSSDNTAVATVDQNGNVQAVGIGTANVIATCGAASATCRVTVSPIEVASICLNADNIKLYRAEGFQLIATVLPVDATDPTVTWSSSNENVAEVDADGYVFAYSLGTATITATAGNLTATCQVTVVRREVESVTILNAPETLYIGEEVELSVDIFPSDADDTAVVWSSSDESVLTVDQDGKVTAVGIGTADIRVASVSDGCDYTCTITVLPYEAEQIILSETEIEVDKDATVTLTATVLPDNTTDKTVVWSSKDESIATVDQNGVVTGVAQGETEIVATCGNVSAICKVTVKDDGGINDVIIDGDSEYDVYDIKGVKVRTGSKDLRGLPRGVYIINGQKYYVK